MADLRCPSCGKNNPSDLDQCSYCGSRLKPGTPSTTPLNPIKPGQMPTKKTTSELESTLPSWLREARQGMDDPQVTRPAPSINIKAQSQPPQDDFLAGLQSASERPSEPGPTRVSVQAPKPQDDFLAGLSQSASDEDEDVPDWLASIRGKVEKDGKSSLAQPPAVEPATDDWLSGFENELSSSKQTPESEVAQGAFAFDSFTDAAPAALNQPEESLDWLSGLGGERSIQPAAESKPAEELSDFSSWLSNLEQPSAPAEPSSPSAQPAASDTPDWLSSPDSSSKAPEPAAPSASGSLDWMSSFDSGSSSPETPAPAIQGDLPDWLSNLDTGSKTPEPAAPSASGSLDWMSSFDSGSFSPETPAPAMQGDLPDWLSNLDSGIKSPEPAAPVEPILASDNSDWLSNLDAVTKTPEPAQPSTPTPSFNTGSLNAFAGDMPDWMSHLGTSSTPETPKAKAFGTGSLPPIDLGETPDWLAGVAEGSALAGAAASTVPPAPLETPQPAIPDLPGDEAPLFGSDTSSDSTFAMDMPDWLSGFKPAETERAQQQTAETTADDIAPVELPSWVQAMRPVESAISEPSEDDQETGAEQEGPLAGFRNILPVNPALLPTRKPQTYGIKLDVSPLQQKQSAVLEQILASESKPKTVKPHQEVLSLRVLRWSIAGILLLIVLIVSASGTQIVPAPLLVLSDTTDFINVMSTLPDSAPVLLAIDYDPGFASELEAASSPVLDYLMLRGARIAFVSTNPTGSFLTNRAVENMKPLHTYESGTHYVNLGYLPGGAAGVQLFAIDPRKAIALDVNRNDAWALFPDINQIDEFAAVIILTDNAETGRMWIEQTRTALKDKPMLMIISAQAEPMIRPYYDAAQVQGVITGLSGGAYYEDLLQRPGRANQYWNAYGIAALVSGMLIFFGGMWNLIAGIRLRRQQAEE